MKISEQTNVQMPLKTVVSLITLVAVGTWAKQLMEADLLKTSTQKPIDQEQYMLIEFSVQQLETMQKEMESMMSNTVNINFLKTQVAKLQDDVEKLKDKVRANGNY